MPSLLDLAKEKILVCDGATGTMLHKSLPKGSSLDLAVISHPEAVLKLHLDYINAGADIIETHTFGTSRAKLARKAADNKFEELNLKAVKIAREARDISGKNVLIAGSIGPSFSVSDEEYSKKCDNYAEQAVILEERGCDFFMLETFTAMEELKCAINAVKAVSSLPIVAHRTIADEWSPSPEGSRDYVLKKLLDLDVDFVGLNCGAGPDEYIEILEEWGSLENLMISVQPNAGVPVRKDGRFIYPAATPEYFAYFAKIAAKLGVKIIGGCCGTTPDHIKAIYDAVKYISPSERKTIIDITPPQPEEEKFTEAKSDLLTQLQSGNFTTVVQLDPPKGTNLDSMLQLARIVKESGKVAAVDINANPLGRLHFDSLWLAGIIEDKIGIGTIPHITPRDASLMGLESQLLGAWYKGVKNVLVITGDPSQKGDYPGASDVYQTDSIGLVRTVSRLNEARDWGGNRVGDPPSFVIGVAVNPGADDRAREIEKLKKKIDAGARFAMSQVFFSWDIWESFWESFGANSPIPVLVGVWPLTSFRLALRIHNEIPEIKVPDDLLKKLELAGPAAREVGWEVAKKFYDMARNYAAGAYLVAPYKRGETILQLI
jgi:methionine synthase I (cobalamin-dependent)/5,10-methylenetetrahydrofolate reductase